MCVHTAPQTCSCSTKRVYRLWATSACGIWIKKRCYVNAAARDYERESNARDVRQWAPTCDVPMEDKWLPLTSITHACLSARIAHFQQCGFECVRKKTERMRKLNWDVPKCKQVSCVVTIAIILWSCINHLTVHYLTVAKYEYRAPYTPLCDMIRVEHFAVYAACDVTTRVMHGLNFNTVICIANNALHIHLGALCGWQLGVWLVILLPPQPWGYHTL